MILASLLDFPFTSVRKWDISAFLSIWTPALIVSMTASLKSFNPAEESQASSIACNSAPDFPDCSVETIRSFNGCRLAFVLPRMKAWSRWSIVDVIRVAASESVRATQMRSVPMISACARMATRRLMCSLIGTSTFPAM